MLIFVPILDPYIICKEDTITCAKYHRKY